jgi:putative flippase GtrA
MMVFAGLRVATPDMTAALGGISVAAVANYVLNDRFVFRAVASGMGEG